MADKELMLMVSKIFKMYSERVAKELVKNPAPENMDDFSIESAGSIMMAFCMMGFCEGDTEKEVADRIYKTFKGEGKDFENALKAMIITGPTSGIVH